MAGEREPDDRALNRSRFREPKIADAFEQARVQAEGRERDRRRVDQCWLERRRGRWGGA